jgi:hypothetical protein
VQEHLNLGKTFFGDRRHIAPRKLSRKHNSLASEIISNICAKRIMHRHLRRSVKLKLGHALAQNTDKSEIRNYKRINAYPVKVARKIDSTRNLAVI